MQTPNIREAIASDRQFVVDLMTNALAPYYGGDHRAHAERIFSTHISGGIDRIGHFSFEQRMFIITVDGTPAGMLHLVGKRQGTYKISPIIVSPLFRGGGLRLGRRLLAHAEKYAQSHGARSLYCTVAESNKAALMFFLTNRFIVAGRSASHYKEGVTETMLYKLFTSAEYDEQFDRAHVSVLPFEEKYRDQVSSLLTHDLPADFLGITTEWIQALFDGYQRRDSRDINQKFKLIFVAVNRDDEVIGVAASTPKKGEPVKLMPFIARTLPAFVALLVDTPFQLKPFGRKLYMHIAPTVEQTIALQQHGWTLDAAMPAAYHDDRVTQQWSLDVVGNNIMQTIRVKQHFLKMIRDGRKTLEVRVGYSNIKTIRPGAHIRLESRNEQQLIRVNDIRQYASVDDMLRIEDFRRIAPELTSAEEVRLLLRGIYPPDKERRGIFVLEIEPVLPPSALVRERQ